VKKKRLIHTLHIYFEKQIIYVSRLLARKKEMGFVGE